MYLICLATALIIFGGTYLFHSKFIAEEKHIKVGYVFVGDEMTPYTDNFIRAADHVQDVYGDRIECIYKYNVTEEAIMEPLQELVDEECDYIITASYGYGPVVKEMAAKYPDIEFCAITCDNANKDTILPNFHNCMGEIYQGRYICGVVAGMKLREMIDQGTITPDEALVGYVAAYPYAEVISGYTAFFLGVRSVVPEATMLVKYTNTWSSYSIEKKTAIELIDAGCVLISQHSDTNGPAVACENASGEVPVYHVGYNQSMTEIAPTSSLISCSVDYSLYFEQSIGAVLADKKIESVVDANITMQDAYAGIEKDWVKILDINEAIVAPGTDEAIDQLMKDFKAGNVHVFQGDYTGTNPYDLDDKIDLSTEYIENKDSSSPTFNYVLDDVITVIE